MNQNYAIEVNNIAKKFKIYHDKGNMLKERALHWSRNKYEEHCVLNGISFSVKKGEAIGLVGHNGCGKSTTLKMLTRIMYPDSGTIEMCGRVSSLIELGAGFHPDLSGRENIYINASIFGLSKSEIDKRVEEIIRFSELADFIDNPVRTYSSGMYMRLAFSVAINVDADILLIDEILAVGDANFQIKCFNKLMEIKNNGTTIVIVSHSLSQIEQICDRSLWIHEGQVKMIGEPRKVHQAYLAYMGQVRREAVENELIQKNETAVEEHCIKDDAINTQKTGEIVETHSLDGNVAIVNENTRIGSGEVRFVTIKSKGRDGKERYTFGFEEQIQFELAYVVSKKISGVVFGLSIFRIDGVRCYGTNTRVDELPAFNLEEDGIITIVFDKVKLLPGKYYIDVCIEKKADDYTDYLAHVNEFEIISVENDIGVFRMDHEWIE